jgi:hypothetical protein
MKLNQHRDAYEMTRLSSRMLLQAISSYRSSAGSLSFVVSTSAQFSCQSFDAL